MMHRIVTRKRCLFVNFILTVTRLPKTRPATVQRVAGRHTPQYSEVVTGFYNGETIV